MSIPFSDDWPHLAKPADVRSAVLVAAIAFALHAAGVDFVGAVPGAAGHASAGRLERCTADFALLGLELFLSLAGAAGIGAVFHRFLRAALAADQTPATILDRMMPT